MRSASKSILVTSEFIAISVLTCHEARETLGAVGMPRQLRQVRERNMEFRDGSLRANEGTKVAPVTNHWLRNRWPRVGT